MHIAGESADKGFVNFNFSAKQTTVLILQGKPDAVHNEPSGFLSHAKTASDFIAADSVLVVRNHPHRGEPLIESDWGILKNGANLDGELPLGVVAGALPNAASSVEFDALRATSGANHHTTGPALRY